MSEPKMMRFRCDICGRLSDKQETCCKETMQDLMSPGCMSCQGCGMH